MWPLCVCVCVCWGPCVLGCGNWALEPPDWEELRVLEKLAQGKGREQEQRQGVRGGWSREHMGSCGLR